MTKLALSVWKKCDCLIQVLIGEDNTDMIDSLARHVIFWDSMKLEARRGILHEWIRFAARVGSEGDPRKFLLNLMLDEDFSEGGTELDIPLVFDNAPCKMLNAGREILNTEVSNPIKEHGRKALKTE